MEGKSVLNRNMSDEVAQILDQECTKILLRSLIQMFEGPLLLYLQKSANLCCEHVDQPLLPLHTITTGTKFLLLQAPSQVWNPSPTWHKPIYPAASSIGFHYPYSISLPPQSQSSLKFLSWYVPTSCRLGWFFSLFQKNQETSLEWCRLPQCAVVTFLYSQLKSLQEKPLLFCVLSSPSWQLCCS